MTIEKKGAEFSVFRTYRYALWRIWDEKLPLVLFIGLNPSTASADRDDATIRRVRTFSMRWGYGGFYMMNLFALVTPDPKELEKSGNPLGDNDGWIEEIYPKCGKIIFAWGDFSQAQERSKEVIQMFREKNIQPYALVINKNGSPRHPLYVKSDTIPVLFEKT